MLNAIKRLFNKERNIVDITSSTIPAQPPKPKFETFSFNVAGVTKENDEGKDIQDLLQKYGKKYCRENDIDLFGGYTNKEILDDIFLSEGVKEFEDLEFDNTQVTFVPEPDNEYDPNAIKVYIDYDFEHIHVGYVPKKNTAELLNIIETKQIKDFSARYVGGKIKEVVLDSYTDKYKVESKELTLGVEIDITYRLDAKVTL